MFTAYLSPYSFVGVDEWLTAHKRAFGRENDAVALALLALNEAVGVMERECGRRRLAYRTYRTPVALGGCTWDASGNVTVAGGGVLSRVKAFDDVLGAEERMRVASITSDTVFALSRAPQAAQAVPQTLTFGSGPLTTEIGRDEFRYMGNRQLLMADEWPVKAQDVFAVNWINIDGTKTPADITVIEVEGSTGEIVLRNSSLPWGRRIEIECAAGYRVPSATDLGSPEWDDLAALQSEIALILFQDRGNMLGRWETMTVGQDTVTAPDKAWPDRILRRLRRYRRVL